MKLRISSSARPAFIANSSEDELNDDSNGVTSSCTKDASLSDITGKNGSLLDILPTCANSKNCCAQCFTAIPGVLCSVSCTITTPYDAWKMFIHQSILGSIVKFTTDDAVHCEDVDFSLTLDELKSFIAL